MNTKKMRAKLKDAGLIPKRSNVEMTKQYKETFSKSKKVVSIVPPDNEYTYIGSGDEPPHMINFMGQQKFFRGDLTVVNNPDVLAKIRNHACFVKGSYDKDKLFDNDEEAKKGVEDQRLKDRQMQGAADRLQAKYK